MVRQAGPEYNVYDALLRNLAYDKLIYLGICDYFRLVRMSDERLFNC